MTDASATLPLLAKSTPSTISHHRTLWGAGTFLSLTGTGFSSYRAVVNFLASRNIDGGAFSLSTILCAGACVYCIYRVVISLKSRNVESIPSSSNDLTVRAHEQMLKQVDARLKALLPLPDLENVSLSGPEENLYSSIEASLCRLEKLLPEVALELENLKASLPDQKDLSPEKDPMPISPPGVTSTDLLSQLEALSRKLQNAQSSRGSSTASSAANSPAKEPGQAQSPSSGVVKKITFGPINELPPPTGDDPNV